MNRSVQELAYAWPLNLTRYEAAVFMGLSLVEALAGVMAFVLPLTLLTSKVAGVLVGALCALLVLLTVKKIERLGNLPLPVYLLRRYLARREQRELRLALILGTHSAPVYVEDADGTTLVTVE